MIPSKITRINLINLIIINYNNKNNKIWKDIIMFKNINSQRKHRHMILNKKKINWLTNNLLIKVIWIISKKLLINNKMMSSNFKVKIINIHS